MAQQRQSFGPGRVLAHVSLIVTLPMVGGVVAGLVADGLLGTSPLLVLSGLAIGTLVTVLWLRSFIVTNVARLRSGAARGSGGDEEQRQGSAERS